MSRLEGSQVARRCPRRWQPGGGVVRPQLAEAGDRHSEMSAQLRPATLILVKRRCRRSYALRPSPPNDKVCRCSCALQPSDSGPSHWWSPPAVGLVGGVVVLVGGSVGGWAGAGVACGSPLVVPPPVWALPFVKSLLFFALEFHNFLTNFPRAVCRCLWCPHFAKILRRSAQLRPAALLPIQGLRGAAWIQ